jgi:hypothetical protein
MAKSRKEGKPKKNRANVLKWEKIRNKNFEAIRRIEESLNP